MARTLNATYSLCVDSETIFWIFSGMGYHRESVTNLTYEDIPDLSDDDHIEGEEPMLQSMAEARRGGGMSNFPITVTSSARSKKAGASGGQSGEGSPSPSSYGMTLEHYITQMVTTPASAAATSGILESVPFDTSSCNISSSWGGNGPFIPPFLACRPWYWIIGRDLTKGTR